MTHNTGLPCRVLGLLTCGDVMSHQEFEVFVPRFENLRVWAWSSAADKNRPNPPKNLLEWLPRAVFVKGAKPATIPLAFPDDANLNPLVQLNTTVADWKGRLASGCYLAKAAQPGLDAVHVFNDVSSSPTRPFLSPNTFRFASRLTLYFICFRPLQTLIIYEYKYTQPDAGEKKMDTYLSAADDCRRKVVYAEQQIVACEVSQQCSADCRRQFVALTRSGTKPF